jgi:hypothetical protein
MRYNFVATALAAAVTGVNADFCSSGSTDIAGNYYCKAVNAIKYSDVGTAGSYNQVTDMASDGTCTSTAKSFSGAISPLDEEVSIHFRGPIHLKQFAAYTPSASSKAKREVSAAHARRHGHSHQQFHKRNAEPVAEPVAEVKEEKRTMVTATIDGQVVSWTNNWFGYTTSTASASSATAAVATAIAAAEALVLGTTATSASSAKSTASSASSSASSSSTASASAGSGAYTRIGYYDSESQTLDGLVFLGNHGGAGSGVFDE